MFDLPLLIDWFVPDALGIYWTIGLLLLSVVTSATMAVFGIGGGIMMLAALLVVLPPFVVLPVHSLIQLMAGCARAQIFRQFIDWKLLGWYCLGSVLGAVIASQVFVELPETFLLLCMGSFVLWSVWSPKFSFPHLPNIAFSLVGAVLTFLSFFIGATGPVFATLAHNRSPEKRVFIATHAMGMNVQHTLRHSVFVLLGFSFYEWIPFVILTALTGYLGTVSGSVILNRLPENLVRVSFKWVLTILALRLIYSALFPS